MASIIIWESGPTLTALQKALGEACVPIRFDEMRSPDAWIDELRTENARLLVHVNLPPRRIQRRGLSLVKQLRWEWGMTVPVLFLSFEAEETLRATPHGDLLTQPGHGFLWLPPTVDKIKKELDAVPPLAEPERYWRSAAAAALGLLLDGPAAEPIKNGPGPTITWLQYWQRGRLAGGAIEHLRSNQWWHQWSSALTASRKRLTGLAGVPDNCFAGLDGVEKALAAFTTFVQKFLDSTTHAPTSEELTAAIDTVNELLDAVKALAGIRHTLRENSKREG